MATPTKYILGTNIPLPKTSVLLDLHHIALYVVLLLVGGAGLTVFHQWRMDSQKAKITQAAQEQVIAAADKRMADREKDFNDTVKQLETLKSTPKTTTQTIIEHIPQLITLPEKVTVEPERSPVTGDIIPGKQDIVLTPANQLVLNDKLVECKECEVERSKLKSDVTDEQAKSAAAEKERDAWMKAAKGGSVLQRIGRAAKWFAIGAAAGAIAAKAVH